MKKVLPVILISGAFGLGVGVGLGVWLSPTVPDSIAQKSMNSTQAQVNTDDAATPASNQVRPSGQSSSNTSAANLPFLSQADASGDQTLGDFAATWNDADQGATAFERRMNRAMIISQWAKQDLEEALRFVRENVHGKEDLDAISALYMVYAEKDLSGAIASIDSWTNREQKLRAKASILQIMGESDPFGAVKLWLDVDPRGYSQEVTYAAYQEDPARFMAEAAQLARDDRHHAMDSLVAAMVQDDSQLALTIAMGDPSIDARNRMINTILRKIGEQDPYEAIKVYQSLDAPNPNLYAIRNILAEMAVSDPEVALEYARNLDDYNDNNLRTVLIRIAQNDPAKAWTLANEESDSVNIFNIQQNVFSQIVSKNLTLAQEIVDGLQDNRQKEQFQSQLISFLAREDPQNALDYAYQIGDPQLEERALNNVVNQLARDDPKLALDFAMDNRDLANTNTISSALQGWMNVDGEGGLRWLTSLPDEDFRNEVGASVAQRVSYQNPELANQILDEITVADSQRSNLTRNLATAYLRRSPEKALEFSMKQQNPDLQYIALESVFAQWKNYDAETARSELLALNLEEGIQAKLLEKIQ